MKTILILGGGASGMAAALAAAGNGTARVILLERQSRVGRKLLATGNGRCNLSNLNAAPAHYHGEDPGFSAPALTRFDVQDTLDRFRALGLLTRADPDGRVYPVSDSAASVLDTLRLALAERGVAVRCPFEAAAVKKDKNGFLVTSAEGGEARGDRLIIACGGAAGSKLGGTRGGYALLRSLGHSCTPLRPSLVQLKTENTWTRSLKGIRTQAALTLLRGGRPLSRAVGEVQFTDYGISGPAVFDLSRAAADAPEGSVVSLRLLPELDDGGIAAYLDRKRRLCPAAPAECLLTGALHNSLGRTIVRRAGIAFETPLRDLGGDDLRRVAAVITRYTLPLTGTTGLDHAQVTAGGIRTEGFDPATMESRVVPGLYACGEVLDIDGDCGGYNLQWAWSSGRLAGVSAAGSSKERAGT